VADFMSLALYDPRFGYYARAAQRSGRAGDFFTSVDVGSIFGRLLGVQIAEMLTRLRDSSDTNAAFDLVECGAGNGRLTADVLRCLRTEAPDLYDRTRVHLIEASATARLAQSAVLGELTDRLATSSGALPQSFRGVVYANELVDALPTHQVVMREAGLREVYVAAFENRLVLIEDTPSSPELEAYLERLAVDLEPGWTAEISLMATAWMRDVSRRLERGFAIVIDYGHPAAELYSASHSAGTLTSFSRHTATGADSAQPAWLLNPGEQDLTAHVDFTNLQQTAVAEGMDVLAFLDQTYFLLGLSNLDDPAGRGELSLRERLALKTLLLPGGLGSTMKVLILGKNVGAPSLRGCSYRVRVT
jgi:SAM-dependent MidA family methyltransferase